MTTLTADDRALIVQALELERTMRRYGDGREEYQAKVQAVIDKVRPAPITALADIEPLIRDGKTVCWKQDNYVCQIWHQGTPWEHTVVVCTNNDNAFGLYHRDGVTSNHKPEDFYVKEGT